MLPAPARCLVGQPASRATAHLLPARSVAVAANAASLKRSTEPATATRALLRSCTSATRPMEGPATLASVCALPGCSL